MFYQRVMRICILFSVSQSNFSANHRVVCAPIRSFRLGMTMQHKTMVSDLSSVQTNMVIMAMSCGTQITKLPAVGVNHPDRSGIVLPGCQSLAVIG